MAAGFQWKIRLIGITCKIKPIEIICHLFYFNRRDAGPHSMSLWVPPVAFIVSSKSLQTHGGSSSWFSIYFLFIFFWSFFATFLMVCQSQVTWATLSGLRRSRASEQYMNDLSRTMAGRSESLSSPCPSRRPVFVEAHEARRMWAMAMEHTTYTV